MNAPGAALRFLASLSPTLRQAELVQAGRDDLLETMQPHGEAWRALAHEAGVPCPPALAALGDAMADTFIHVEAALEPGTRHGWDLLTPDDARANRAFLASFASSFPELVPRSKMLPVFGQDGDLLLLAPDGAIWTFMHESWERASTPVAPSFDALLLQLCGS